MSGEGTDSGFHLCLVWGFAAMLDAISAHKLKPVVGRVFGFGEEKEALRLMGSGKAYGKIGIEVAA